MAKKKTKLDAAMGVIDEMADVVETARVRAAERADAQAEILEATKARLQHVLAPRVTAKSRKGSKRPEPALPLAGSGS